MDIMSKQDLVSIITPAYNCEKYISETIDSVIEQNYSNWEMIIINDCSNDSTHSIIEGYKEKDSRIRYIRLEKNVGVAKSRNIGLSIANGKYIAFLDSDDLWKRDKLDTQIKFMKENNYAFTYTGYEYIDSEGNILPNNIVIPYKQNYTDALKNTAIGCLTVMIDRDKVGSFEMPILNHGEDHMTWVNIIKKGYDAYGLDKKLASYRILNNSLSSNKFKVIKHQWNNYRKELNIPMIKCCYYFLSYIFNAIKKRYIKMGENYES